RNWGYDGVAPFAAQVDYGGPAALARLVDAAHAAGLSAFLDVVYNHLGPEGAYLGEYGPYFTSRHKTPWGDALDFSLPPVRRWFYEGQHKPSFGRKHGTPAAHLRARHFVVCAQNHDQVGNRARGERLTELTDVGGVRAAAAVVALQPALPLYFQGEEWAAREPFQYFVSHTDPALVEAVRKGRQEEFKGFAWSDVPDPLAEE